MSTHAETIAHTQVAIGTCEELTALLAQATEITSRLEQTIRAALDGTSHIEVVGQHHQTIMTTVTDALHATQRMREHLAGLIAQFHASG